MLILCARRPTKRPQINLDKERRSLSDRNDLFTDSHYAYVKAMDTTSKYAEILCSYYSLNW